MGNGVRIINVDLPKLSLQLQKGESMKKDKIVGECACCGEPVCAGEAIRVMEGNYLSVIEGHVTNYLRMKTRNKLDYGQPLFVVSFFEGGHKVTASGFLEDEKTLKAMEVIIHDRLLEAANAVGTDPWKRGEEK